MQNPVTDISDTRWMSYMLAVAGAAILFLLRIGFSDMRDKIKNVDEFIKAIGNPKDLMERFKKTEDLCGKLALVEHKLDEFERRLAKMENDN